MGGHDIWDRDQYLNIWVCKLAGSLAGYAQFPGGPAPTDGIVVDPRYFGTVGSLSPGYDKGRVTTHEIGHWLNLRHIWGDYKCGDDFVYDTPTQERALYGCPSFPHPSCNNASDMFMNYMDYTSDHCKYMFTYGQAQRMNSALQSSRSSLQTSNGCVPLPDFCTVLPSVYKFGGATITDGSGADDYRNNTDCQWLIQPAAGGVITLTFEAFTTEAVHDTLVIYDGPNASSPVLGKFSGTSLPPSLTSTGGEVFLRFVTNGTNTSSGWTITYSSSNADLLDVITCSGLTTYLDISGTVGDGSGTSNYSKNLDCEYLIQPPGASTITLHFTEFRTELNYDLVKIYDGSSVYAPLIGIYSGTSLPPDVTSSSGAIFLKFMTDDVIHDAGWSLDYTTNNTGPGTCAGTTIYSQYSGTVQDGSGTSNYSDELDCIFLIQPPGATSVTVHFTEFETETHYDSIIIYDGPSIFYPVLASFSGFSLPPDVTATSGVMLIRFVTDINTNAAGWSATYTSTGSGGSTCAGMATYTAASGTVEDGSAAGYYSNNTHCQFLIAPPDASTITLHFTSLQTEYAYDYVKIYNGPTNASPVLGIYSGSVLPPDITATKGAMLIEFITDELLVDHGWTATYTSSIGAVNIGDCNGLQTFTSPSGKISDGSGEENYFNDSDCMFLIQPANATSITLEFLAFDIEQDFDFVRVYDGTTTDAPLLGTFSGIALPPVITSSGGALLIHFISDYVTSATGWYAVYNSSNSVSSGPCDGLKTFTGPSGTISDGSEGANYSNDQHCQFLLQPAGVSKISISFTSFETEVTHDYVKIYDGASTAAPLLGTYSGINLPPGIVSSGPSLFIEFVTDNAVTKKGWSLNYTSIVSSNESLCSGLRSYVTPTGTLADGSGIYNYSNNMDCRFLIQPPGASSVSLHFTAFNTESGYDFVRVYNGSSTAAPLIGVFSGETLPSGVVANSGTMLLEFTTNASNTRQGWEAIYTSAFVTGVTEENEQSRVFVYPNPADKEIYVRGLKLAQAEIKVVNTIGETVYTRENALIGQDHKIDVSTWSRGLYYIVVTSAEGKVFVEKFIKYE